MRGFRFDDRIADDLFAGAFEPETAPPGLQELAGLVHAARPPVQLSAVPGEDQLVKAFAATVRAEMCPAAATTAPRRHVMAKVLSAKAAVVATTLLLGAGVAAAATGSLPRPLQSTVASVASHIGISLPNPDAHRPQPAARRGGGGSSGGNGTSRSGGSRSAPGSRSGGKRHRAGARRSGAPAPSATRPTPATTRPSSARSPSAACVRPMPRHRRPAKTCPSRRLPERAARPPLQHRRTDISSSPAGRPSRATPTKSERPTTKRATPHKRRVSGARSTRHKSATLRRGKRSHKASVSRAGAQLHDSPRAPATRPATR